VHACVLPYRRSKRFSRLALRGRIARSAKAEYAPREAWLSMTEKPNVESSRSLNVNLSMARLAALHHDLTNYSTRAGRSYPQDPFGAGGPMETRGCEKDRQRTREECEPTQGLDSLERGAGKASSRLASGAALGVGGGGTFGDLGTAGPESVRGKIRLGLLLSRALPNELSASSFSRGRAARAACSARNSGSYCASRTPGA
jgi:hypothetical protein